jgi:hypothetical protein
MIKSSGLFVFCAAIFCLSSVYADTNASQAVRNVNPDPNGEPWLVGSMKVTPEVLARVESISEWPGRRGLSKMSADVTLPDHVYNYQNPEFPPTFAQIGSCCSAASGIGYCYTYESNLIKGASATSADNLCAYGFLYDFLDNGKDQGCWYYDAWDIAKKTGCLSKTDFGGVVEDGPKGMKQTKWGNGYQMYHNAYSICRDSSYFTIKVGTADGLTKLKRWMYDHGRGDKKGGVAIFSWFATHTFSKIPSGMPDAGKKIVTAVSGQDVTEHAMTFAGYDDRIGPSTSQLGAVLLQNSWGATYGDQGRSWVPYSYLSSTDGIWKSTVYVTEVRPHTVKLDYKVTITHDQRNLIQIKVGFANSANATSAASSCLIGGGKTIAAFNYCGGAFPMEGSGGSSTIEIGLDATDYYNAMTAAQATFFLIVTSKGGTGNIGSFSLMDYSSGSQPKEIPCSQKNVAIATGTTTLSIPYFKPSATAVKDPPSLQSAKSSIAIKDRLLFLPSGGTNEIRVTDLQGREVTSFHAQGPGWVPIKAKVPRGEYFITVKNQTLGAAFR